MSKAERLELETIMTKVFDSFQDEHLKGTYMPLVDMSEEKRKELVELHYLYINDDSSLDTVGCYSDWPHGRGIFINNNRENGVFIIWCGEEDQMRIMAMNKGNDVQAVWDLFYNGVEAVHKALKTLGHEFDFHENLGYLSSCPTNIGTGMRASVHVNLPAFKVKQDLKAYVKEKKWAVDIRGTHGESKDTKGVTVYDVSNRARVGSNCIEQIKVMVGAVQELLKVSL